jgi:hypothetical protein
LISNKYSIIIQGLWRKILKKVLAALIGDKVCTKTIQTFKRKLGNNALPS